MSNILCSICCISVVRAILLNATGNSMDASYDNVSTAYWTCVETNITVVIACVMTLKPLVSRAFPSLFRESSNSYVRQPSDPQARVLTIGSRPVRAYNASLEDGDLEAGLTPGFDPVHPTLQTIKDESSPSFSSVGATTLADDQGSRTWEKP